MEHLTARDISWTPAPPENFTGEVLFGPVTSEGRANMLGVHFSPGARTDWHTHPEGQILYVTSGAGRVGTEDGSIADIAAGDSVYSPPGEVHWHGAGPHSHMTHLSITTGGATEWLPRKVTDEEYGR